MGGSEFGAAWDRVKAAQDAKGLARDKKQGPLDPMEQGRNWDEEQLQEIYDATVYNRAGHHKLARKYARACKDNPAYKDRLDDYNLILRRRQHVHDKLMEVFAELVMISEAEKNLMKEPGVDPHVRMATCDTCDPQRGQRPVAKDSASGGGPTHSSNRE